MIFLFILHHVFLPLEQNFFSVIFHLESLNFYLFQTIFLFNFSYFFHSSFWIFISYYLFFMRSNWWWLFIFTLIFYVFQHVLREFLRYFMDTKKQKNIISFDSFHFKPIKKYKKRKNFFLGKSNHLFITLFNIRNFFPKERQRTTNW